MLSRFRALVQPIRRHVAAPLVARGVSADALTLSALPLAVLAAGLIAIRCSLVGGAVALLAVTVDFIDGEVARLRDRSTPFGDLLDAVVDRVVEGVLLAALALRMPLPAALSIALGALVSYVKARVGLVIATDNRDWPGVGDRADRVVLILVAVLLDAPMFAAYGGAVAAERTLWLLAAMSAIGAVQRTLHARRLIAGAVGRTGTPTAREEPGSVMPDTTERGRDR